MQVSARIRLNEQEIAHTAGRLKQRIEERFPDAGLARVCQSIQLTAEASEGRIQDLQRPMWLFRGGEILIALISVAIILHLMFGMEWLDFVLPSSYAAFIELVEPTLGSIVFLTAFFVLVINLKKRWKQQRVLAWLNELRNYAHVIDMHQLTKDPERRLSDGVDTSSSPQRNFTNFELGRYLDYCSEMFSLLSKLAAVWAQAFPEPVVLTAVDQIEMLTTGLSRKIWQKLMVLEQVQSRNLKGSLASDD